MIKRHLLLAAVAALPLAPASAASFFSADLGAVNSSGVTGTINFALDGDELSVNLQAQGVADGYHFLHIHGLEVGGVPVDTTPPPPPVPPNGDTNNNGVLSTNEAKAGIGNVILSLAPHTPGTSGELVGVYSSGGTLSFSYSYDLASGILEPGYTIDDLLPLDYRVFDMHGGIVPAGATPDGTTMAPGMFDPNLPVAAGAIAAVDAAAVPEPAAWMTMIAGFGIVGGTMRRRRLALAA